MIKTYPSAFCLFCSGIVLLSAVGIHIFINKSYNISEAMAKTGLLVLSNLTKIPHILASAQNYVSNTLYVSILPVAKYPAPLYSEHIIGIYTESIKHCNNLDVRVLLSNLKNPSIRNIQTISPVDIVIFDKLPNTEPRNFAKEFVKNLNDGFRILNIDDSGDKLSSPDVKMSTSKETYDYVALGGTFDRLHTGHKILLSEGILRANKHLTVGVTDVNMIKSKKLWELIEPVDDRIRELNNFLLDVDPTIEYNVVPIHDMYGPTKDDSKLQLLVVSKETQKGGDKVNEKRAENKLPLMAVHCIELAGDQKKSDVEEDKVSSSNKRIRLLGSVLKEPKDNLHIPPVPYVIGLTGGIASGKTKIAETLGKLGAGVINCDKLAHELYRPGQPLNATIAETFGEDVIDPDGQVNRKKLGQIVFNDPTRLIELNNIMWPSILESAREQVLKLGKDGYRVVVMEAAVLIQANWMQYCHQVWTSIIPQEEAIKRLVERNGLTEQAAIDRLSSQPSNQEQVAAANVVFSSLWSYEFTSQQVEGAWKNLNEFLDKRNV